MFSVNQKRYIASEVQRILRETGHPELPAGEINFHLHVDGAESWSWADIRNNGAVANPTVKPWNERLAAPKPVPVSERLPGSKDCDEKGRVWAWRFFYPEDDDNGDFWELVPSKWLDRSHWTHWLPATALAEPAPSSPAGDNDTYNY